MDAIDALSELSKGEARGGKYFRRVATGNAKRPWRYYYTKAAYEREHGDASHRKGDEERRHIDAGYERDMAAVRAKFPVGMGVQLKNPDPGERKFLHDDGSWKIKRILDTGDAHVQTSKGVLTLHPDVLMQSGKTKKRGGFPRGESDEVFTQGSAKKSMQPTMSKGLMSFQEPYGEGKKLSKVKDDWLPDYVDAFLEEAYEHERQETAHRDPNLLDPGSDPGEALCNAIYNEFIAYCAQNQNLARAKEIIPVTKEYVTGRLADKGLIHVNTENHNAEQRAQVAGYFPTRMALSEDGHAAADTERNEMIRHMGTLEKSEDHVMLPDEINDNPMNALESVREQHSHSFHDAYGASSPLNQYDPDCLFHGREVKKSEAASIHGLVCTCK